MTNTERCSKHPAFYADYCPGCGTSAQIPTVVPAKIKVKVESFSGFCHCPNPQLDESDVCVCGVAWTNTSL
jgi:hypothetical protein